MDFDVERIGRMSQLSALDHPQYARRGNAFTLEQG